MSLKPNNPLLENVSQYEVDFVIPRLGVDLPLGIDPFLLYKSRDSELASLHQKMVGAFNEGIGYVSRTNENAAEKLFDFPEVREIGFGYSKASKRGSGVGRYLSDLIIETLRESPALGDRGVRHIEEMQLVSVGIAQDRTSDMAANFMKEYLIGYTQRQCQQLGIPLTSGVPIEHIFDFEVMAWYSDYVDLPLSPINNEPLLFVPRRIVRTLPWINYDDYFRQEFSAYLRAKRVKTRLAGKKDPNLSKSEVVAVTRAEVERIDSYVKGKEESAAAAQPSSTYLNEDIVCDEAEALERRIKDIDPGRAGASVYQRAVFDTINFLFNPQLADGEMEVKTVEGTERRDIIFLNESDENFWSYVRTEHSSLFLMFEIKNTKEVKMGHLNQTVTYLGDRLGRLGFIITRNEPSEGQLKKAFSIYNDSQPRKIILILTDNHLFEMMRMKCRGENPTRYIQKMYRYFRTSVQ